MPGLNESINDVIESQPEISDGVNDDNKEVDYENLVDSYKRSFSPELHLTDDDGNPKIGKRGKLLVKKGKSPSKVNKDVAESSKCESYRQSAEVVCATLFGFGMLIAGDEGKPSKEQADYMIDSYERYFESRGIEDIPPGLAVFMSTAAYAVPLTIRAYQQKESKVKKATNWLGRKIFGRKKTEVKKETEE